MADEKEGKEKEGGILQNKDLLNAIASALDPEAANIVNRLLARIPQDSWLRGATTDRLLGIVKSLIESQAEKKGPLVAVAGEKFTDYLDIGRTSLSGKGSKSREAKRTPDIDPVAWMNRFFQHAEKRLAEAKNPEVEKRRLEKEFQARKAIFDLIKAAEEAARVTGADEPVVPAADPVDWDAKWKSVRDRGKKTLDRIDAGAAKAALPVGRLADWLESKT